MERILASIQRALEIRPIENADAIELVRINGWQCVTRKGEFRVGDLGVFLEIDAIPPDHDQFRFLWQPKPKPEDGTSTTFCIDPRDGEFHVCGRSMSIKPGDNIYWRVARKHDLEAALRRRPSLAIQGEVVGPGIQKNRLGLTETSLFAFSAFDIAAARYLDHDDARAVFAEIGVPPVTVIEEGDCFQHTQESLLTLAEGKYPGTNNEREGLVVRPRHEAISPTLNGRLSFKVISNRFLLRTGEWTDLWFRFAQRVGKSPDAESWSGAFRCSDAGLPRSGCAA
jgi:hypothetical protein